MPRTYLQLIATLACCALCLFADSSTIGSAQETDQPAAKQKTLVPRVLPGELRSYEPDSWSVLSVRAKNNSDAGAVGNISVYLEEDNRTQYARRYWVPANATRLTWLPIRTPADIENGKAYLDVSILNFEESDGESTLQRKRGEQLVAKTILKLATTNLNIGLIEDRPIQSQDSDPNAGPDVAYEIVDAVRNSHKGGSTLSKLLSESQFLPPFPAAYEGIDQLILTTDRLSTDSGGIAAVRSWIFNGGHAWIMADRVDLESVRMLLGNAAPYELIDRIELNEFSIFTPRPAGSDLPEEEVWSSDEPVDFLRVAATSVDVHSSIDGWPASFSIPMGKGRVFFTTLAARGWSHPDDLFAQSTNTELPIGPTLALKQFAVQFNDTPKRQNLLGENLKPVLTERIGYKIPSRSIVALLLGLSCIAIAGIGVWLAKKEKLELIALVVPLCTAASAIAFILLGNANRSSVPATASSLRLAQVETGMDIVRTDTLTGFYSPDTAGLPLESKQSGSATPDIDGLDGIAKRTTWDDSGAATWENISVAAGSVRFARTRENHVLDTPIHAQASFGAGGLEGTVVGIEQLGELNDAIVQSPSAPNSAVSIEPSGKFQINPDDLLAKDEFITGTMLTDTQQHRQEIYRGLLDQGQHSPQVSALFAWSDDNKLGFANHDSFQQSGATLFAIPLEVNRTAPNSPFLVPTTFIRAGYANARASQLYDSETRTWLKDVNFHSEAMLRFIVPASVIPCQLKTAKLTIKINAPSRSLEVLGMQDGVRAVIETHNNPSGVIHVNIDDPKLLQLDEKGSLQFGIKVSQTQDEIEAANRGSRSGLVQTATWQVDYMRLQVNGVTD